MNATCIECIHCKEISSNSERGICKKEAPRPALAQQMQLYGPICSDTIWPAVGLRDPACGDFKRPVPDGGGQT